MFIAYESENTCAYSTTRLALVVCTLVTLAMACTVLLYTYTHQLLTQRIEERLLSIAQTASLHFSDAEILAVQSDSSLVVSPALATLTAKLQKIAAVNPFVSHVYIIRQTDDPGVLEFVADAYSLNRNSPQKKHDTEMPLTNTLFTSSAFKADIKSIFAQPTIVPSFGSNSDPVSISAFAPIGTKMHNNYATLGVDLYEAEYISQTRGILYPFLLFVIILFLLVGLLMVCVYKLNIKSLLHLKEIDRQKDELLSIVSHQLATPISTIRYLLEMFQDGDFGSITKKQSEQFTKLQIAVSSASELVRMILDVSRIQMGKMQVNRTQCNVESLIDGVIDIIQPKIMEKKIKLVTTITRPMPSFDLDPHLMRMALENIVTNAIKYTNNKGTIWIEASVKNAYFYCKVTDTGCGIPESEQSKLFDKLFRASNVRDTVPGTGFGLYVAKGALEAQGGSIRFYSKEGEGTTFYMQVPVHDDQAGR